MPQREKDHWEEFGDCGHLSNKEQNCIWEGECGWSQMPAQKREAGLAAPVSARANMWPSKPYPKISCSTTHMPQGLESFRNDIWERLLPGVLLMRCRLTWYEQPCKLTAPQLGLELSKGPSASRAANAIHNTHQPLGDQGWWTKCSGFAEGNEGLTLVGFGGEIVCNGQPTSLAGMGAR